MREVPSLSSMAATFLVALSLVACETVPYTGRSQLQLISPQEEGQMGAQAYQQILGKAKVSDDGAANEMVTRVGKRIAAVSGHPEYQWEYRLIQDDKQVNAFALPGGKVAVYTGILPVAKDEAGLAVVLGHEISHATARHGGERLTEQLLIKGGETALALGLQNRDPHTVSVVLAAFGVGAQLGYSLRFSRTQE